MTLKTCANLAYRNCSPPGSMTPIGIRHWINVSNYLVETEVPSFQRCGQRTREVYAFRVMVGSRTRRPLSGYRDLWIISCRAPRRGLSPPLRRALLRE